SAKRPPRTSRAGAERFHLPDQVSSMRDLSTPLPPGEVPRPQAEAERVRCQPKPPECPLRLLRFAPQPPLPEGEAARAPAAEFEADPYYSTSLPSITSASGGMLCPWNSPAFMRRM